MSIIYCVLYNLVLNITALLDAKLIFEIYELPLKDIDDCSDHKCVNGQCQDGINSYTCVCNGTGYEGKLCENGLPRI